MRRTMAIAGFGLMIFLALVVSLGSARYLLPVPISPAPLMLGHLERWPWAVIAHVAGGVTALTLGFFQLVTRKGPRRVWHRFAGRIYVLACLSSAVSGFWLALYSTAGPVASAGFGGLAVAWFATTVVGWRKAVAGAFGEHRRWMIRSLSLTFAAVTLRILLPLSPLGGLDFDEAYRVVSFLCWVPNLLLAELWLRVRGWDVAPARPSPPVGGRLQAGGSSSLPTDDRPNARTARR